MEAAVIMIVIFIWVIAFMLWFLFILGFYLAMFGFVITMLVVWILMLVDCLQREFPKSDDKTMWTLVIVLTGWIGALVYYITIKRPADHIRSIN
ncbi:MAG: hypothetical protein ACD_43C00021G0003 [uncultured bacterium]|nr:MAG: hypothetical protein ACD_43C00021G0003 [uncultured bacterium]